LKVCQWLVERHALAWTRTPDSHQRTDAGWWRDEIQDGVQDGRHIIKSSTTPQGNGREE